MKKILIAFWITTVFAGFSFTETNITREEHKTSSQIKQNQKIELVYLYVSNAGMIGYFNDGFVRSCPKCDFCKSNILAMFKSKSFKRWNLKKPTDFISYEEDNGWVLADYKWNEKVPQF